jgi:release factor glutamine methyltransferase
MPPDLSVGLDAATTRAAALVVARTALIEAGLDEAALDARLLTLAALGIRSIELVTEGERPIGADGAMALHRMLARRLAREPVARILGMGEFWGLPFRLSPGTLVPRPDTETAVNVALAALPDPERAYRILDLGTGSGVILVALLSERPGSWGIGLDRSAAALATARDNAALNGVDERAAFLCGDWAAALIGRFDLVVSNPPYIPAGHIPGLDPEVTRHDPMAALDGGPDGLDAYRAILREAGRLLAAGGKLVLEIGYDQADTVAALGIAAGFPAPVLSRDLGGRPRVLAFQASGTPS